MHKDLVENRKWISENEYREGLALAQLAPGPLAAQLGIYIGFVHYRFLGATLIGIAFVLPSFLMVLLLGIIYKLYGGLSWIQAVFYGVGASVIGIIALSSYKLTIKSIGKFNLESFKSKWILWMFFIFAIMITYITEQEQVLLFVAAGLLYMIIKAPPKWWNSHGNGAIPTKMVGFLPKWWDVGVWWVIQARLLAEGIPIGALRPSDPSCSPQGWWTGALCWPGREGGRWAGQVLAL